MSPLKLAFQQSRSQRNIDVALPVLKAATLHVVVGSKPQPGQKPEWFLTESPTKGRYCVTVSESDDALAKIRWPKVMLSGEQLLAALPPGIEIVIVYADGGDYINREQLAWYSQSQGASIVRPTEAKGGVVENNQLLNAARVIVARNITSNVCLAAVAWLPSQSKLRLCYHTLQPPSEEDVEEADIAMTELLAEFPEITDCETVCTQRSVSDEMLDGHVVFTAEA